MSQFPKHGFNDPDSRSVYEQDLSSAEALLAGTMALMTGYAQSGCDRHRDLMARKIISSLSMLSGHPNASSGFKATAANLRGLWIRQLQQLHEPADAAQAAAQAAHGEAPSLKQPRVLWHATSELLQ